jgi:enamine deaminase RidA (YjgF/YER057c/UK114 family)
MIHAISRRHTSARMSRSVCHNGVVYLCGQTAKGSAVADVAGQTREILSRVDELLAEAGSTRSHLLSAVIYLRSMDDFAAINAVWDEWVPEGHAPARTAVEAFLASNSLLVEITVIAAVR